MPFICNTVLKGRSDENGRNLEKGVGGGRGHSGTESKTNDRRQKPTLGLWMFTLDPWILGSTY